MTNNKLQSCHLQRLTASLPTRESDVTKGGSLVWDNHVYCYTFQLNYVKVQTFDIPNIYTSTCMLYYT